MKIPAGLQPLIDEGVVDAVLGALKSGKEASVYVVDCRGDMRCAKVYKDAGQRGFQKLAMYQEGRKFRRSRDMRAMDNRSRHGRREQEAAWKNAEVDALYRLAAAGVRVPKPHGIYDGVMLMELVTDADGYPAKRLNDVHLEPAQAREWYVILVNQVVRMLCAGLIHGDLSEYNVLAGAHGPVIIDLPQAVDAAGNNNAFQLLQRDVNNLRTYFARSAPELAKTEYAHEIWRLYRQRHLSPETPLTGKFEHDRSAVDMDSLMYEVEEVEREHKAREAGRRKAELAEAEGKA